MKNYTVIAKWNNNLNNGVEINSISNLTYKEAKAYQKEWVLENAERNWIDFKKNEINCGDKTITVILTKKYYALNSEL